MATTTTGYGGSTTIQFAEPIGTGDIKFDNQGMSNLTPLENAT
jgi:hypothetical protein